MKVYEHVVPYFRWLFLDTGDGSSALRHGFFAALAVLGLILAGAYLVAAFRHGPVQGGKRVLSALRAGLIDIVRMSPRRIYGLASLAFREAFRRHIWVALVVLLLVLAFTGWFLDPKSEDPAKLSLTWVVTPTTYLMFAIALYLSSLSLPADIKNRTIYTVVTKPVRPSEIILGRILGFTAACTVLLAVMGVAGYLAVIRAVSHTHTIELDDREPVAAGGTPRDYVGRTSAAAGAGHRHDFVLKADSFSPGIELTEKGDGLAVARVTAAARAAGVNEGDVLTAVDGKPIAGQKFAAVEKLLYGTAGSQVRLALSRGGAPQEVELTRLTAQTATGISQGHAHEVIARYGDDGEVHFEVGPAEGSLVARAPIYGELAFRDRQGEPTARGISVGKLDTYRSNIVGGTLAAAVWTFDDLRPEDFPEELPLDLNVGVYRTHKGNVEQGIGGSLALRNPETGVRSKEQPFRAKEFRLDREYLKRKQPGTSPGTELDIFEDLTGFKDSNGRNGKIELWLQCVDNGQSFAVARADVYIRGKDASFALNFVKVYVEIWLQLLLVTSLAVMFSTFLSGPVAILVTVLTIAMGLYSYEIKNLTDSVIYRNEMEVIDFVRLNTRAANVNLENQGILRLAEMKNKSSEPGTGQFDIERLEAALALPPGRDPAAKGQLQTQWQQIGELRREANQRHVDLEGQGVLRVALAMQSGQARYPPFDPDLLEEGLKRKIHEVGVLDRWYGGGSSEAFYRMITQMNLTSELEPDKKGEEESWWARAVKRFDGALMRGVQSLMRVLPDFQRFNDTNYLASGYNIQGSLVAQHATSTLAFSLAAFVAGFFCLKYREVAA